jgi:hypothetical protein
MRLSVCLACFLVMLSGCREGAPPVSALSVTITPASATVTAYGTQDLSGSATGFTATPVVVWYMQEGPATPATRTNCGYQNPATTPSLNDCIYGYVTYKSDSGTSPTAVYHAPGTPGTYHVVLQAMQFSGFALQVGKTGTAEIVVTP